MYRKLLATSGLIALLGAMTWAVPAQALPDNEHYCCWQSKGPKGFVASFIDQTGVGLIDKCKFKAICNPCDKNASGIQDLNLHYCLYQCKGPKVPALYQITDQFNPLPTLIETKKFKFLLNKCTKF